MEPVDLENGESSIGVTLTRDEGESKDCDRIRTLGEGVRGGGRRVAMMQRGGSDNGVQKCEWKKRLYKPKESMSHQ
jgi:hypothetical protein